MNPPSGEASFALGGLRCAGCAGRVERELRAAPGVSDAAVSFATERALVRFDPRVTDAAALRARVESLGYRASRCEVTRDVDARAEARAALARLLVAAFLAGNVMVISFALYFGALQDIEPGLRAALRWLALGLSLPALAWCALPFWRGAWRGLRRRELTLDVPIVVGISTAFAASVAGTVSGARDVFSDSAATIVFLMLLGRALERGARVRASDAVDRLAARAPAIALRCGPAGIESVRADSLAPGDRVVVPAGQTFPADGRLLASAAEVDESLLSGESRPIARAPGDSVRCGTTNLAAEVEIEVTHGPASGTVARLVGLLERAQAERPPLQLAVDRVAQYFAPAVLGLAALTALGHWLAGVSPLDASLRAAAVLIVACPCALGLATPTAVSAALGRAAALGLWFKSGAALERAARIDRALLDKTGTLTLGRLQVTHVIASRGFEPDAVSARAAAIVGSSSHPVARALRAEAERRGVQIPEVTERRALPGAGVESALGFCGSRALLERRGVAVDAELAELADTHAALGASAAFVSDGGKAMGALILTDAVRADAASAVARLAADGVPVALVSGDSPGAVASAAWIAGISDARGGVTPEEKVEAVTRARAAGARVVFAGDGINDAAALAAADLGFAFAHGSDVTLLAADVVSHDPRLESLCDALELGRVALHRIREGLGIAIAYNAVALPLAIAGVIGPLTAALAMSASSLLVTGNALRLRRFGRRR